MFIFFEYIYKKITLLGTANFDLCCFYFFAIYSIFLLLFSCCLLACLGALSFSRLWTSPSFPFVSSANIEFALFFPSYLPEPVAHTFETFHFGGLFLCFACLLNFCMRFSSSTFLLISYFHCNSIVFPHAVALLFFWPNVCTSLMFSSVGRKNKGVCSRPSSQERCPGSFYSLSKLKFKASNCQPVTQKFNICSPYNLRALFIELIRNYQRLLSCFRLGTKAMHRKIYNFIIFLKANGLGV